MTRSIADFCVPCAFHNHMYRRRVCQRYAYGGRDAHERRGRLLVAMVAWLTCGLVLSCRAARLDARAARALAGLWPGVGQAAACCVRTAAEGGGWRVRACVSVPSSIFTDL